MFCAKNIDIELLCRGVFKTVITLLTEDCKVYTRVYNERFQQIFN